MRVFFVLALIGTWLSVYAGDDSPPDNLRIHAPRPTAVQLTPCQRPGSDRWALCGEFEVYENRETMTGRTIPMQIVIYPATGDQPVADPIFQFTGGPGMGAAEFAGYIIGSDTPFNDQRDIVYIDQRGTGGSNGLKCKPTGDATALSTWLDDMFPPDYVDRCREALSKRADLSLYTTPIAMDDINEVRAALGYDQINITGGSYGTRACLTYMDRHGETVRTSILAGVAPSFMAIPETFAEETERALQAAIRDCQADPTCHKTFPNLAENVQKIRSQLAEKPVVMTVTNPLTKAPEEVTYGLNSLLTFTRAMLYTTYRTKFLPLRYQQMAAGDFEMMIIESALYARGINNAVAEGMYLSVTCSEDDPHYNYAEAAQGAKGTFLGDYRIAQQRRACDRWVRSNLPAGFFEPVTSHIPTVILSGEWDPVTPPHWGDEAAVNLSNATHIVVPYAAHGLGMAPDHGLNDMLSDFLAAASWKNVDFSDLKNVKRPSFALEDEALPNP